METITLALGCFWCSEAIFKRLKGVEKVASGYANSSLDNPSYEEVCSEETDATEAVQIKFDPQVISLEKLLEIFWHLHDPTTLNRQGADIGSQYRSAVFYSSENQKRLAEKSQKAVEKSKIYQNKIVTKIEPLKNFYSAESNHQNYYEANSSAPYCQLVIDPKINKLLKEYAKEVKEEHKQIKE